MLTDITFAPSRACATRLVQVAGSRPGSTTVTGVPANLGARALLKLQAVVFWPVPERIGYDRLMAYRDGEIVLDILA